MDRESEEERDAGELEVRKEKQKDIKKIERKRKRK